jgi:Temperature dependent protein affecting M2 dsRNA replication
MDVHVEFLKLLEEKGLVMTGDIDEIKGNIGIDAEWWLRTILPVDLNSLLMGSISMTLRPSILSSLKSLNNFSISPIIIFSGIPLFPAQQENYSSQWNAIAENFENLNPGFLNNPIREEVYCMIFDIIKIAKGEAIRAPYFAAAQIAYLKKANLIRNVFGMTDLIFYNVPVIIIEIMQTKYKYINSQEVLNKLGITALELKQAFIMRGYFNKVLTDMPLSILVETLKYVRAEIIASDPVYLSQASGTLACNISLGCETPRLNCSPNTWVKEYGKILSKELIFAMCMLKTSPGLLYTLSFSKEYESFPRADSSNYRRIQKALKEIKSSTISIISTVISTEDIQSPIKINKYYSDTEDTLSIKNIKLLNWNINAPNLLEALKIYKKNSPDLQFCLKWHYDNYGNNKDLLLESDKSSNETDIMCIQSRLYLKFLELIGYISPIGKPMLFGKSLMRCDSEWQYSALYLQELLKLGLINGRRLSQNPNGGITTENFEKLCSMSQDDTTRHAIVLVSRIFSLVQPTLHEELWTGKIDYDLAQFHSLINSIFYTYQQAYEALVIKEFLSEGAFIQDFIEIKKKSPMMPYPHPALGIAIKRLMLYENINQVATEMPQMADLFLDLHRGWMFWKNFVRIISIFKQHDAVPEPSFIAEISLASKKLKIALLRARVHVS